MKGQKSKKGKSAFRLVSLGLQLHYISAIVLPLATFLLFSCFVVVLVQDLKTLKNQEDEKEHRRPVWIVNKEGMVTNQFVVVTKDVKDQQYPLTAFWIVCLTPVILSVVLDLLLLATPDIFSILGFLSCFVLRILLTIFGIQIATQSNILAALAFVIALMVIHWSIWLMVLRRISLLRKSDPLAKEAMSIWKHRCLALLLLLVLLVALFFRPGLFGLIRWSFAYAAFTSGLIFLGIVESILMAFLFPFGVPTLIDYLNFVSGLRSVMPTPRKLDA